MEMDHLVSSIEGFANWSHAEKIRFFAWMLHADGRERFIASDIRKCYATAHLAEPKNIHQQIAQLVKQQDLLEDSHGYRLARPVRDALAERHGQRATTVQIDKLLSELPARVPNLEARAFVSEAISCFRVGAFRAAIVMTWNLAYDHLCFFVADKHLAEFNRQWPLSFPREHQRANIQAMTKREDFAELKESQVIRICRAAGIITGDVCKVLEEKLTKRNSAAHPSDVIFTQIQVEAFIDELVRNVVLRLA